MSDMPDTAMLFAAGKGTRMRSYESALPKPLVKVAGKALIDHALDQLVLAGVKRAVVNLAYKGEMIEAHLAGRRDITILFSHEGPEPLETGGGIMHALPLLGTKPFFAVNSDILWLNGPELALSRLATHFDEARMDSLLLVCPVAQTTGYEGQGDFSMASDGRVRRRGPQESAPFVFAGVQILSPRLFTDGLFAGRAGDTFSLSRLFDRAGQDGWITGVRAISHDSTWMHVGDAEGVRAAEKRLASSLAI